jgi:hypothetical protein
MTLRVELNRPRDSVVTSLGSIFPLSLNYKDLQLVQLFLDGGN